MNRQVSCSVRRNVSALATGTTMLFASLAGAQPDPSFSYFVPQVGAYTTPTENGSPPPTPPLGQDATGGGAKSATRFFRACPNNDGGSSLPNNARIKIVVRDANGNGINSIPASDICIVINGGTAAQGFTGDGADSVIANSLWNPSCPDFPSYGYTPPGGHCIQADGPTDANGVTYLTFTGANGIRDSSRKWGHYDSDLPVFVQGIRIFGAWNSAYAPPATPFPSYELRIKDYDFVGGLGAFLNQGESISVNDLNALVSGLPTFWKDFDWSGTVSSTDINAITVHLNHNCTYPYNP